ncbi:MAG: hypothetical protein JSV09_11565 [Thermoplasmata archaeon]|nr:MAG: hypothetical protein JSV09_11565 [Thermoplasmata archaeon]
MTSEGDTENKTEEQKEETPQKGLISRMFALIESRNPKLALKLRDLRIQAFILFILLSIFYLNLIIWDFYFSADSMWYGILLKNWFETGEMDNFDLFHPAHPLIMPIAIMFTHLMIPLIGKNYLLSYAIMDAILGGLAVSLFYLVCNKFINNRKYSLICSLALAFSFTFWENCEMAEDRVLGYIFLILYIPVMFSFVGEIKPFKRLESLKTWQMGLFTGIFMGLTIAVHFSLVLLFLFTLILGWRYYGLKFFISQKFIWYIIGTAIVCGIVFGLVAWALGVSNLSEFMGMFTGYHTGNRGSQYFALSDPGSIVWTAQIRGMVGGVFTAFFMFVSDNPIYNAAIIGICAVLLLLMAFIMINARKNKVVSSFYILIIIWFAHFIFFAPDDRNSWAFLLVPVWLSVGISLDIVSKEGASLMLLKRRLPDKIAKAITPIVSILIVAMFINNTIVFADAHFNHDDREKFVQFVDENIQDDDSIIIMDTTLGVFFGYFSDRETIAFVSVVTDPEVSLYINESFNSSQSIYLGEFFLLDSYVQVGSGRHEHTYEARLEFHREYVERFNSMYIIERAYEYEWSDIYIITALNETG